jgi:hypothetical protein
MVPLDQCSRCSIFLQVAPTPRSIRQGLREQSGRVDPRVDLSFNDWSTSDRAVQRSFKSGWVELPEGAVEQSIDIALGVWLSLHPGKHEKTLRWRELNDCGCADHSQIECLFGGRLEQSVGGATSAIARLSFAGFRNRCKPDICRGSILTGSIRREAIGRPVSFLFRSSRN